MASISELVGACDALLQPQLFRDYGPNGLQVQGKPEVKKIVSGVTASLALIEAAIAVGADVIFVHHGLFWRGQDGRLTGWLRDRVKQLMAHDINLLAYHLPLDAHATLGNNAQLGQRLGLTPSGCFGEQSLGWVGSMPGTTITAFAQHVEKILDKKPLTIVPTQWRGDRLLGKVAWCTGGAQSYFEDAIAQGVDVFLTGEVSEPQAHYARECGVAFMACGHHATERYGAPALTAHVAAQLGLEHTFIDIDNPA
jgi:dinuclear metal center YbgI/SA1388 family protein